MKPYVLIAASFAALAPIQAYAQTPNNAPKKVSDTFVFPLTVSTGASTCLPKARGNVIDHTFGNVENLEVIVRGMPPNTDFRAGSANLNRAISGVSA